MEQQHARLRLRQVLPQPRWHVHAQAGSARAGARVHEDG